MRNCKITLILVLFTCLWGIPLSQSQTTSFNNDPNINPDANACFDGGLMYEACQNMDVDKDYDFDQIDKDWLWTCGWYLHRVQYGIFPETVLDGICRDVVEIVVVEEPVKDDDEDDDDEEEEFDFIPPPPIPDDLPGDFCDLNPAEC